MAEGSACAARLDELRKRGNLPSPKGVALEIMRLVGSQNANTSDIVRVLQADPGRALFRAKLFDDRADNTSKRCGANTDQLAECIVGIWG